MSGYLGYDVDLLPPLLTAMRDAEAELTGIRCADVDARAALQVVSAAASALRDHWIPFVRDLLACAALADYRPATIDDGDLVNSYLASIIQRNGWRTSTDPLGQTGAGPVSIDQARQLALWLSAHPAEIDLYATTDTAPDDVVSLAAQLAVIAASPPLTAAFLHALDHNALVEIVDHLAARHADLTIRVAGEPAATDRATLADLDAIFRHLGDVIAATSDVPYARPLAQLLGDVEPYGAALVVRRLGLDAAELGRIAGAILTREQLGGETATYLAGVRAADVLLATVIATTDGPSRFLVAIADHPELVLTAADGSLTNQVLLAGSSPDVLSPSEQVDVIAPLFAGLMLAADDPFARYYDVNNDIYTVAATMIAPYLLSFFIEPGDPLTVGFELKARAWDFLADNADCLRYFIDKRTGVFAAFAAPLGIDHVDDYIALNTLGSLVQLLDDLAAAGRVSISERAQIRWELLWGTFGKVAGKVPGGKLVGKGVDFSLTGARSAADARGWTPEEIATIHAETLVDADAGSALVASLVTGATFDSFVHRGRIPATTPRPPIPDLTGPDVGLMYQAALEAWAVDTDLDPDTGAWLLLVSSTMLNTKQSVHSITTTINGDNDSNH